VLATLLEEKQQARHLKSSVVAQTLGETASGAVPDVRNWLFKRLINSVPSLVGLAPGLLSTLIKLRLEAKACPHRQARNVSG